MSDFASRVRDARKAKGWSQKQLADSVAASQAQVSQIETGKVETGKLDPSDEFRTALDSALYLGDAARAEVPSGEAAPAAEPAKRGRVPKADKPVKQDKQSGSDLGFESLL